MKRVNGKINCKRPCFWDFEHHLKKYLVEIISSIVGCGSIPTFTNPWKISDKWFYHGSSKISGEMVLSETKLHRRNHSRVCNRCLLTNREFSGTSVLNEHQIALQALCGRPWSCGFFSQSPSGFFNGCNHELSKMIHLDSFGLIWEWRTPSKMAILIGEWNLFLMGKTPVLEYTHFKKHPIEPVWKWRGSMSGWYPPLSCSIPMGDISSKVPVWCVSPF